MILNPAKGQKATKLRTVSFAMPPATPGNIVLVAVLDGEHRHVELYYWLLWMAFSGLRPGRWILCDKVNVLGKLGLGLYKKGRGKASDSQRTRVLK